MAKVKHPWARRRKGSPNRRIKRKKLTKKLAAARKRFAQGAPRRLRVSPTIAKGTSSTRLDINEYRGGPTYIQDVGVIDKRRG